jgi:anti-sigma-K factor RskA
MIDERHEELAALAAFDLLSEAERREFDALVADRPELQALADQLRAAGMALAHTAPAAQPPDRLRARLLADIARRSQPPQSNDASKVIAFPAWRSWLVAVSLATAAGLALATAWLGQRYLISRAENDQLRQQVAVADLALRGVRNQLAAERLVAGRELADAQARLDAAGRQLAALDRQLKAEGDLTRYKLAALTSLLGNSPQALAIAVWDPAAQKGILKVSNLPALAADKDYQLWVIDPQYPVPVDGGVFKVDARTEGAGIPFSTAKRIGSAQKFAVSVERKGGAPQHQGPIVLLSQ